jgi:Flp pilus assembly protein TadG
MTDERRKSRRVRDDRGSLTIFMVLWSLVIVMVAALVIDVGLAISQRERAADLADQAARAEAQNVSTDALRQSGAAVIASDDCGLATQYVASAASSIHYGTATINTGYGSSNGVDEGTGGAPDGCVLSSLTLPGNTVTVSVNLTYTPFVFDLFSGSVTVTETGTATAATGN